MNNKLKEFIVKVFSSFPYTSFQLNIEDDETMSLHYDSIEVTKKGISQVKNGTPVDFNTFGLERFDLYKTQLMELLYVVSDISTEVLPLGITYIPKEGDHEPMFTVVIFSAMDVTKCINFNVSKYERIETNAMNLFNKYEV